MAVFFIRIELAGDTRKIIPPSNSRHVVVLSSSGEDDKLDLPAAKELKTNVFPAITFPDSP